LNDEFVRKLNYNSLELLAKAIYSSKVNLSDIKEIKPVFRLHPPRKGYKRSIKRSYKAGGVTGYRGEAINDLIKRMV
jgi:large subunit ribosomal protein L30